MNLPDRVLGRGGLGFEISPLTLPLPARGQGILFCGRDALEILETWAGSYRSIASCQSGVRMVLKSRGRCRSLMARSVLCYFAARELGLSTVKLARLLHTSQPTVSQSVQRGEKIASEKNLHLVPINQ